MRAADPRVVSDLQQRLIRIVAAAGQTYSAPNLRLEGGTALAAYYLQHRASEDLDFFADPGLNAADFAHHVGKLAEPVRLRVRAKGPSSVGYSRLVVQDLDTPQSQGVRIDIAVASAHRLEPLDDTAEGIKIASYRDLCAGKLHAICDRFEPRDFIDLHAILHFDADDRSANSDFILRRRIRSLVADVVEIDPGLDPHLVGQAIQRGLGQPLVERLPLRLIAPIRDAQLQDTIRQCIDECAAMVRERIRSARESPPES
jgi:hypothetical protein